MSGRWDWSDAHSELKDQNEDERIGFSEEPDGPDLPCCILADNAFVLKNWLIKHEESWYDYQIQSL